MGDQQTIAKFANTTAVRLLFELTSDLDVLHHYAADADATVAGMELGISPKEFGRCAVQLYEKFKLPFSFDSTQGRAIIQNALTLANQLKEVLTDQEMRELRTLERTGLLKRERIDLLIARLSTDPPSAPEPPTPNVAPEPIEEHAPVLEVVEVETANEPVEVPEEEPVVETVVREAAEDEYEGVVHYLAQRMRQDVLYSWHDVLQALRDTDSLESAAARLKVAVKTLRAKIRVIAGELLMPDLNDHSQQLEHLLLGRAYASVYPKV